MTHTLSYLLNYYSLLRGAVYLTVTALLILLFKLIFRNKLSAKVHVLIWAILLVRFLVPVLPSSPVSIFNVFDMRSSAIDNVARTDFSSGALTNARAETDRLVKWLRTLKPAAEVPNETDLDETDAGDEKDVFDDALESSVYDSPFRNSFNLSRSRSVTSSGVGVGFIAVSLIYPVVTAALALYFLIVFVVFTHRLKKHRRMVDDFTKDLLESCKDELNIRRKVTVYYTDSVPFLIGLFRPAIYLPESYTAAEKRIVLLHELNHMKNLDILYTLMATAMLIFNWFNPVMWLSYFVFKRDIEVFCDERTLRSLDDKQSYARLLLKTADRGKHSFVLGTTSLQSGKADVKRRIRYMAFFKKPAVLTSVVSAILILTLSAACLTDGNAYSGRVNARMSQEDLNELCSQTIGSEVGDIMWADEEKMIFTQDYGLFVYDYVNDALTLSVDVRKMNIPSADTSLHGISFNNDGSYMVVSGWNEYNYKLDLTTGVATATDLTMAEHPISTMQNTFMYLDENGVYVTRGTDVVIDLDGKIDSAAYHYSEHLCAVGEGGRKEQKYLYLYSVPLKDNFAKVAELALNICDYKGNVLQTKYIFTGKFIASKAHYEEEDLLYYIYRNESDGFDRVSAEPVGAVFSGGFDRGKSMIIMDIENSYVDENGVYTGDEKVFDRMPDFFIEWVELGSDFDSYLRSVWIEDEKVYARFGTFSEFPVKAFRTRAVSSDVQKLIDPDSLRIAEHMASRMQPTQTDEDATGPIYVDGYSEMLEEDDYLSDYLDYNVNIGAEMPSLVYADEDVAIISGTCGIIVYDFNTDNVIRKVPYLHLTVDLNVNIPYVLASEDGKTIYIRDAMEDFDGSDRLYKTYFNYQLDWKSGLLTSWNGLASDVSDKVFEAANVLRFDLTDIPEDEIPDGYATLSLSRYISKDYYHSHLFGHRMVERENDFLILVADDDWSMKSLRILSADYDRKTITEYYVFTGAVKTVD